jgi:hypothetical protein
MTLILQEQAQACVSKDEAGLMVRDAQDALLTMRETLP